MLAAGFMSIALAQGAAAHQAGLRDPFEPLIDPEATGTTTTTTTTTDTVDTTTTVDTTDEGLPTTGTDAVSWVAVAYVLVAAGIGALALARFSPAFAGRARESRGA